VSWCAIESQRVGCRAYFESEYLGLDERERFAVHFDEAFAFAAVGDCGCCEVLEDISML
jgi:hypothetical protein